MTSKQADSPAGKALINAILDICHDGEITLPEVASLHAILIKHSEAMPAITFLRSHTRQILIDETVTDAEAYALKRAMERVVPKEVRSVVATHLAAIGLPVSGERFEQWMADPVTRRQIEYILNLGGDPRSVKTKGEASKLIDQLLTRRPPTPRQVMLIRFFDRTDLLAHTKDEVSDWIDRLFTSDIKMELAWHRYKQLTDHDPISQDPTSVPVGEYLKFV